MSRCARCPRPISVCSSSVRTSLARSRRCLIAFMMSGDEPHRGFELTTLTTNPIPTVPRYAPRSPHVVVAAAALALVVVARPADLLDARGRQRAGTDAAAERPDSTYRHGLVLDPGSTAGPACPAPAPRRLGVHHPDLCLVCDGTRRMELKRGMHRFIQELERQSSDHIVQEPESRIPAGSN